MRLETDYVCYGNTKGKAYKQACLLPLYEISYFEMLYVTVYLPSLAAAAAAPMAARVIFTVQTITSLGVTISSPS